MRTITAPGVEIKEIDKSQYSPAMVGTACYVMGFANKGEAYQPMEFTSRAAWTTYYGEPDTEAERYFYNACIEVLNQNGRLYCARLPYDNQSFEKMVAFNYSLDAKTTDLSSLEAKIGYGYEDITKVDPTVDKAVVIHGAESPYLIDLEKVDFYRTDEEKPSPNTFVIVDKTCASYGKIQEDHRKGKERELIGIMPVITTAANGLYAQKLIEVENRFAKCYESCGSIVTQLSGNDGIIVPTIENRMLGYEISASTDLVKQLNSVYKDYQIKWESVSEVGVINTIDDMYNHLSALASEYLSDAGVLIGEKDHIDEVRTSLESILNNRLTAETDEFPEEVYQALQELYDCLGTWPGALVDIINSIEAEVRGYDSPETKTKYEIYSAIFDAFKLDDIRKEITETEDHFHLTINQLKNAILTIEQFKSTEGGYHAADGDDALPDTVSFDANTYFPTIQFNTDVEGGRFDRSNLKHIGVIVYKMFIDPGEGNKINFEPVEAFAGSLFKDDRDINTGMTTFIDTIINSQSNYIYFFSNCFSTPATKKIYTADDENAVDILIAEPTDNVASLGFYEAQVQETISISKSIYDGMNKCFEKVSDINERDIDIVPDAGISNIASYLKALYESSGRGEYDLNAVDELGNSLIKQWKATSLNSAVKTWKAVLQKLDVFCKKTRKDCMFIADGLRPLVVQGQKKVIRPSNPKNTIDANILPYVKFQSGLNTSYGAGYLDWFEVADDYSGDTFWLPPSIKAMGCYINTDVNFNYWDAPAGLTRGIIAATDVAFSPTPAQAGAIYEKNWNYSINYPNDGIILEGQKTFQVKPTAFDRVNVRRLFLRLERAAYKVARYFVYEGNTAYTRQRLVDALDPYFKEARIGGGIYDYMIRCNEQNNTPEVIDRNELKVQIGIKPTKTAEFILIDFIALTTGGSFEEAFG